ncbi:hypothetical protein [Streptomyces rishiriensis]|uniref:Uncharacterized protein n=1 Tax=Streptomyces rishiriensis TaxID=68264 RepID=A0ABU0NHI8_STRRH|nr:hypothetical protein [Streptomyces rishiriensis]MDQ0578546.1 hypothetical protein [Streptomyces rishiriensis]
MTDDQSSWTGAVTERLRCCVCGESTDESPDYVLVELTAPPAGTRQWLGAHAGHLNAVLAEGFNVEVHLM